MANSFLKGDVPQVKEPLLLCAGDASRSRCPCPAVSAHTGCPLPYSRLYLLTPAARCRTVGCICLHRLAAVAHVAGCVCLQQVAVLKWDVSAHSSCPLMACSQLWLPSPAERYHFFYVTGSGHGQKSSSTPGCKWNMKSAKKKK